MEQHPVPQNILDVEFKLFGSFSLKQFSKLLIACFLALIIFFLDVIPVIVRFPVMALVVLLGIGMAIIPNFTTWVSGYIKAIFITPRYVWVKQTPTPEVLQQRAQQKVQSTQKVSQTKKSGRSELSQISLSKLFDESSAGESIYQTNTKNAGNLVEEDNENLDRIYNQVYNSIQQKQQVVQKNRANQQNSLPAKSPQVNATTTAVKNKVEFVPIESLKTPDQIKNEILRLKTALQNLVKDQSYKQKESEILERINDLYAEVKSKESEFSQQSQVEATNIQGSSNVQGQNVFGILVDKNDQMIKGGKVVFKNLENNEEFENIVNNDGKFATANPIPQGNYEVRVEHPNFNFFRYNIKIANQKLPAYKFRAK